MSETTIQVPATHIEAVRRGLAGQREGSGSADEVDGLLAQIAHAVERGDASCALVGPRPLLWSAVYDSLCAAAEQLAEDCNEYWRGVVAPEAARADIAAVETRLDLLVGLGAPPVG